MRRKTLVSRFVSEKLHPVLRDHGFRRIAYTWNRTANEFTQVINVQAGKVNMPGAESFTVNLGIFWEKAHRLCWPEVAHTYAREVDCIVRTRMGPLLENNPAGRARDIWWNVNTEDELERVGNEVPPKVVVKALPFLGRFASLRDIADYLVASETIMHAAPVQELYLAVLKGELGDRTAATEKLNTVAAMSESARNRAEIVASQLGLELAHA